jgi:endonuclease G
MKIGQKTYRQARLAVQEAVNTWIYDPNVMLIDLGWPEHGGKLAPDELAIRVHVREKYAQGPALQSAIANGKTQAAIPNTIRGFPVDRPQGAYRLDQWFSGWWSPAAQRTQRNDPMQGGISISNAYQYIYGTLGCAVKDRKTGDRMILSNWHVLAGFWGAWPGMPIVQPGRGDGGRFADAVADFSHHAMRSDLDAAVARLTGNRQLINNQLDLGPVSGVGWAELGMEVVKSGRRTSVTYGIVTAVDGVIRLNYAGVDHLIQNVVTIEPRTGGRELSAGGDSGCVWCHENTMHAVALHFAGSEEPKRALAMDIQPVLDALEVDMV